MCKCCVARMLVQVGAGTCTWIKGVSLKRLSVSGTTLYYDGVGRINDLTKRRRLRRSIDASFEKAPSELREVHKTMFVRLYMIWTQSHLIHIVYNVIMMDIMVMTATSECRAAVAENSFGYRG